VDDVTYIELVKLAHDAGMLASTEMKFQVERWEKLTHSINEYYVCKHGADLDSLSSAIVHQRGQIGVLCNLLRECVEVIDTIESDDVEEFDNLCDLTDKVQAAIAGVGK
jgi:hypothetical protein